MTDTPPPTRTVAQQITSALLGSRWAKVFGVLLAIFALAEGALQFARSWNSYQKEQAETAAATSTGGVIPSPISALIPQGTHTYYPNQQTKLEIAQWCDKLETVMLRQYKGDADSLAYAKAELDQLRRVDHVETIEQLREFRKTYGL